MKKSVLLALFFAFFLSTLEARANIYGLIAMAENPSLNAMQGVSLMLAGYEEAYYYDIYEESYLYEGQALRSSGGAYGVDGYPTYNGYVAIVNTQNTLDYDNPDPHVLYGDFYLGAYFYVSVPGGYLWYDPYGYSYFGGDYPSEYTFAPCYCGGYQVYQFIYLGSLGLNYPKTTIDMILVDNPAAFAGQAEGRPPAGPLSSEIIQNRTIPIQAGEQADVAITANSIPVPPTAILSNFIWSWGGSAVEEWKASYNSNGDPNSRTFIAPVDYTTNPMTIMWHSGSPSGTSYTLRCIFRVNNKVYTRSSTFKVFRPQVAVTSSILPTPTVTNLYDNSGDWALHLGIRSSSALSGINFNYSNLNVPAGFQPGTLQWVQVIKKTSRKSIDTSGGQVSIQAEDVLDTEYPYSSGNPTYDSPVQGFTTIYTRSMADDSFKMYLMYRPTASRSTFFPRWVTLKTIAWGWKGDGQVTLNPTTGQIASGSLLSGSVTTPVIVDEFEFPEWGRNITYYMPRH